MNETPVAFGPGGTLVGVVARPTRPSGGARAPHPAVIFLNAALQPHVGPNRLYVRVARALAELGFPSLRFDLAGVGDSTDRATDLPRRATRLHDLGSAIDETVDVVGADRVVLLGMCSGAELAFNGALADGRVAGAVIVNPMDFQFGESRAYALALTIAERRADVRGYLAGTVLSARSWRRLLTDPATARRVALAVGSTLGWRARPAVAADDEFGEVRARFDALTARGVRLLVLFSGGDAGLQYYRTMTAGAPRSPLVELRTIAHAAHNFARRADQDALTETVARWLGAWAAGTA